MIKLIRSLKRFLIVSFILARQFLIYLPFRRLMLPRLKGVEEIDKHLRIQRERVSAPVVIKETLEKLGPTYVKFGQFLSIRPDLIPPEFCAEFKKLQDKVPPFRFALVRKQLEHELKRRYTDIFAEFDAIPLAAASVAQVHRGRLRTGEEVAVKVQRPGIQEQMEEDILIMLFIATMIERFFPSLRKNQPVMLVHEFSRWTGSELYFRQEGKNALQFAYYFKDDPKVRIPMVYREYTTKKILVMEYLQGENILAAPLDETGRKATARLIADSMLKQIFVNGFFHGDPHAGNILLLPDKSIAYLDFGIVGYLSEDLRAWTFDIVYGMAEGDIPRVIQSFLELCDSRADEACLGPYIRQMNEVLSELHICDVANIPFTQMMEKFLNTSLEYRIPIPHDFVLMSKAIATLEGTCLSLDPDIRLVEILRPFVQKHISRITEFDDAMKKLKAGPFEVERIKRFLFRHGERALRFLERPAIQLTGEGFGNMVHEMEKASVTISSGIIIASLVVFAATLSNESGFERWLKSIITLPPNWPVLPLASLGVAALLWIRLWWRNRKPRT